MILFFPVAGLLFDPAPQFWQICLLIAGGYFRCLKPAAPRVYCSPCVYVAADRYLRSGTDEIVSGIYVRVKVCFVTEQLDIFSSATIPFFLGYPPVPHILFGLPPLWWTVRFLIHFVRLLLWLAAAPGSLLRNYLFPDSRLSFVPSLFSSIVSCFSHHTI